MSRQTLTGELRKSLAKLKIEPYQYYSDPRKHHKAIGVKLVSISLNQKQIDTIVKEVEAKGYQLARVTPNRRVSLASGTRLTFYKK
jgi:hypothetical protein